MMSTQMPPRSVAMRTAVITLALASASILAAQGVPLATRAPRDSQPALRVPVSPSRPPSAVAPRGPARAGQARAIADSAPRTMQSPSLPVDSVRPAPVPLNVIDPRRAPPAQAAPPAPRSTRAIVAEPRVAPASDVPPTNATARCKDGTFLVAPVEQSSCTDHGGLAVVFPQHQVPRRPQP